MAALLGNYGEIQRLWNGKFAGLILVHHSTTLACTLFNSQCFWRILEIWSFKFANETKNFYFWFLNCEMWPVICELWILKCYFWSEWLSQYYTSRLSSPNEIIPDRTNLSWWWLCVLCCCVVVMSVKHDPNSSRLWLSTSINLSHLEISFLVKK